MTRKASRRRRVGLHLLEVNVFQSRLAEDDSRGVVEPIGPTEEASDVGFAVEGDGGFACLPPFVHGAVHGLTLLIDEQRAVWHITVLGKSAYAFMHFSRKVSSAKSSASAIQINSPRDMSMPRSHWANGMPLLCWLMQIADT